MNQPVTDALYGKDHPDKQPPRKAKEPDDRPRTIRSLLPLTTISQLDKLKAKLEKEELDLVMSA